MRYQKILKKLLISVLHCVIFLTLRTLLKTAGKGDGFYMEKEYTYFESEDGFFVGWFDDFPEDVTQGKSIDELEEMLADMYKCLNLAKFRKRTLALA
jgi:hypothetical protein